MTKHEVIFKLNPKVVTIFGEEAFDADGELVTYDEAAVQAYIKANAYRQLRAAAYPPLAEQLGAVWKGGEAAESMKATIQAVKDSIPKP